MKKQTFCLCSILSAGLFISASWWQQGDAKISQNISERGYYAATNSVPLNTLVDITNPENEKTIRVMVIDGLDDPSFLVTLSREAAEAIALPKMNAKVIMEQPSEEEAYSPFRVAGSPNAVSIKPEALIKEESAPILAQGTLPLKQALTPSQTVKTSATEPNVTPQADSLENENLDSDYKPAMPDVAIAEDGTRDPSPVWVEPMDLLGTAIPETSEATTSNETDIPVTISETPTTDLDNPETNLLDPMSTMADSETLPPNVMDEPKLVSTPEPEPAPQSVATAEGTIPSKEGTSEYKLIPTEDRPPEATTFTMLPPESEIAPLPSASLPDSFFGSSQNTNEAASTQRSSSIIQAVELTKIPDPSLFVEPIDRASRSSASTQAAAPEPSSFVAPITASPQQPATASIDSSVFVEPVDRASRSSASAQATTPEPSSFVAPITASPQQSATASIDPSMFVEPLDTASASAWVATPDPSSFVAPITASPQQSASSLLDTSAFVAPIAVSPQRTSGTSLFSIPTIASLEAGQYYLQVIAYNRLEQVESAVSSIGQAYPLTVQSAGTSENPIYRLLIGPLNLGESGALLQRFKGLGYKDAFIRQGS
ncbi:MAG: SPOR domain-containing protein [Treponema sp.]|nr:SPOR domain-containing protein [Treponema sp.]